MIGPYRGLLRCLPFRDRTSADTKIRVSYACRQDGKSGLFTVFGGVLKVGLTQWFYIIFQVTKNTYENGSKDLKILSFRKGRAGSIPASRTNCDFFGGKNVAALVPPSEEVRFFGSSVLRFFSVHGGCALKSV